jgi:hypothetical protein
VVGWCWLRAEAVTRRAVRVLGLPQRSRDAAAAATRHPMRAAAAATGWLLALPAPRASVTRRAMMRLPADGLGRECNDDRRLDASGAVLAAGGGLLALGSGAFDEVPDLKVQDRLGRLRRAAGTDEIVTARADPASESSSEDALSGDAGLGPRALVGAARFARVVFRTMAGASLAASDEDAGEILGLLARSAGGGCRVRGLLRFVTVTGVFGSSRVLIPYASNEGWLCGGLCPGATALAPAFNFEFAAPGLAPKNRVSLP